MPIQTVTQTNNIQTNVAPQRKDENNSKKQQFIKVSQAPEDASTKVKVGVFCTTLIGIAAAMALTFKGKKLPYNPIKDPVGFLKSFTKVEYDKNPNKKEHEIEKLVAKLSIGSIGGGLIGGALFDKKENMPAKIRESVIQLVGNIATPLACIEAGMIIAQKTGLSKSKPLGFLSTITSLFAGLVLGNKVGNTINKHFFRIDDNRKIKVSDLSPQIDDICLATSLATSGNNSIISTIGNRIIPAALMVAGYSTGCMQEHTEVIQAKNEQKELKKEQNIQNNAV